MSQVKKKLGRGLALFLAVLQVMLVFAVVPVSAADDAATSGSCGNNLTWTLNDRTLTISGTGAMYDYPSFSAPWSSLFVENVVINDGVTSIGQYAFSRNSLDGNVETVSIPASVTSIGEAAFRGNISLPSITIPEGVESIGAYAFYQCPSLQSVSIPASVTSIGEAAFSADGGLLTNNITSITVADDNSNYCVETNVLFDKNKTKLLVYPGGATQTDYTIPDSVTSIESYAFTGCTYLVNITIPASVTSIGEAAFRGNISLPSITIPEGVETIGAYAFSQCPKLQSVSIPASVTSIEQYAFYLCSNLATVNYAGTATQWPCINIAEGNGCLIDAMKASDTSGTTKGTVTIQGSDTRYDTLADAIRAAESGSTIILWDGTYSTYGETGIAEGKELTFIGMTSSSVWQVGPTGEAEDYADDSLAGAKKITFSGITLKTDDTNGVGFTGIEQTVASDATIKGRTTSWGETSAEFKHCQFLYDTAISDDQAYLLKTGATKDMEFENCGFSNSIGKAIFAAGEEDNQTTYEITLSSCSSVNTLCTIDDSNRSYQIWLTSDTNSAGQADTRTCSKVYSFANETMGYSTSIFMDTQLIWSDGTLRSHLGAAGCFITTEGDKTQNEDGSYSWVKTKTCNVCGLEEEETVTGYQLSGTIEDAEQGYFNATGTPSTTFEAYAEKNSSISYHVYACSGYVLKELTVDNEKIQSAVNAERYSSSYTITDHNATITAEFTAAKKITGYSGPEGYVSGGSSAPGAQVTLGTIINSGYALESVSYKNNESGVLTPIENMTFIMPDADITIVPTFHQLEDGEYSITSYKNNGNVITATPSYAKAGDTVTVATTPKDGYRLRSGSLQYSYSVTNEDGFRNWKVATIEGDSFTMPAANVTIHATFDEAHNIYVQEAVSHGTIQLSTNSAYYGDEITVTVTPDEGYHCSGLGYMYGTPQELPYGVVGIPISSSTFTMRDADITIYASFVKDTAKTGYYLYTKPVSGGEVYTNANRAAPGSAIKLAATTYTGFELTKYIVTYGSTTEEISPEKASFEMPEADVTVSAEFKQTITDGYLIGISGELLNGMLSVDSTQVQDGETVTVTVTPNDGYRLDSLYYCYLENDATQYQEITANESGAYTFTMPAKNITLNATFAINQQYTAKVSEESAEVKVEETAAENVSVVTADANVTGIGGAAKVSEILADSNLNEEEVVTLRADITIVEENLETQTVTFTVKPVIEGVDASTSEKKVVEIGNELLNGNPITVRLPIPDGMDLQEIVHISEDGTTEYFTRNGENQFTIEEKFQGQKVAVLQVTHFSDFTLNGTTHTHSYELQNAQAATCTEDGYTGDEVCKTCGETVTGKTIPAKGHTKVEIPAVAATCTKDGTTAGVKCSVCNEILMPPEKVPAKGHTWDDGKVTQKPTLTKEGIKTYTCTACNETKTEPIAKLTTCDAGEDCPTHDYKDVKSSEWYHLDVDYVVESGLMVGLDTGVFRPDENLTRAQMVQILYNWAGKPEVTGSSKFSDVADSAWYAKPIIWATEKGIVNGVGDGKFAPNDPVTREQLAKMLYFYAGQPEVSNELTDFADTAKITEYAVNPIKWAVEQDILRGDGSPRKLRPTDSAKRREVAAMLHRYIG